MLNLVRYRSIIAISPAYTQQHKGIASIAFNKGKQMLPKMNDTEKIALEAGTIGFDREIFTGNPSLQSILKYNTKTSERYDNFINGNVEKLCKIIDSYDITTSRKVPPNVWNMIKKDKYLGMIIPESYGGLDFGTHERSQILQKLGTRDGSVAVCAMVPNSLGPGELLLKYGTDDQKNKYLPGLANGDYIPCFGLTSPIAGSDAAGSMVDSGKVIEQDGELGISLNLNKRYITLAPVSNLMGIAFKLNDPDNLLNKEKSDLGITLALLERDVDDKDIIVNAHDPLGAAFPNGTIKVNDYFIPMKQVIGGQAQVGNGWKMLMECLAEGRSVSLPAGAIAGAKMATLVTGTYSRYREQFKVPLSKMEGVQEKLADMAWQTYMVTSGQYLTNALLDSGEKPAVIGAIMKQQTTERASNILKQGMDIMAGSAICRGKNNMLSLGYQLAPLGITVEGSNTLTRSLIIYGQGLMRSHPNLYNMVRGLEDDDKQLFSKNFYGIIGHAFGNTTRSLYRASIRPLYALSALSALSNQNTVINYYDTQLQRLASNFAISSDLVLLLGKRFKTAEMLSGRYADVLSNIYFGYASLWYYRKFGTPDHEPVLRLTMESLLYETQESLDEIAKNYPNKVTSKLMGAINFPWGKPYKKPSDKLRREVANKLTEGSKFRDDLMNGVYIPKDDGSHLDLMMKNFNKLINGENVDDIRDKIIQVQEYNNWHLDN